MKVIALLLLVVSLFASNARAADQPLAQPDFREKLSRATLAVYAGKNVCEFSKVETLFGPMQMWGCSFKEAFVCTATVIERGQTGQDYIGLTTGHCFSWMAEDNGVKYFVADNVREKPVLHEITLLKHENDERYDYALFTFRSITDYPVIDVYDGPGIPKIGSKVFNCNFSLGIIKEIVDGPIISEQVEDGTAMQRRYFVQLPFGPGASGSPIVDSETYQIVGLVEATFPGTQMAAVVIPTGDNLKNFVQDDSAGIRPEQAPKTVQTPPSVEDTTTMFKKVLQFLDILIRKLCLIK